MLLKEFTNGLKRKLENNFISLEEKPQGVPTANLGNCPEEADRGEEEKNSFHFSESWRSATQSHHKKGRGSRENEQEAQSNRKGVLRLWPASNGRSREGYGNIKPF